MQYHIKILLIKKLLDYLLVYCRIDLVWLSKAAVSLDY